MMRKHGSMERAGSLARQSCTFSAKAAMLDSNDDDGYPHGEVYVWITPMQGL
jgi:hypothetical protein